MPVLSNPKHEVRDPEQWMRERRASQVVSSPRRRNAESAKRYAKSYYQRNKEVFVFRATKRECAKAATVSDLTVKQWNEALCHFGHVCAYCGGSERLQKEHVHPVSLGGGFTRFNIVPACIACNQSKKDKPLDRWFKFRSSYSDERLLALIHWIYGDNGLSEIRR